VVDGVPQRAAVRLLALADRLAPALNPTLERLRTPGPLRPKLPRDNIPDDRAAAA
jgi:hypothetical protein